MTPRPNPILLLLAAVLFSAIFGGDIVSNDGTRVPSGVAVALFAFLASGVLANIGGGSLYQNTGAWVSHNTK